MKSQRRFRLAITTGDQDGIGNEITFKALLDLQPPKDFDITVYTSDYTSTLALKVKKLWKGGLDFKGSDLAPPGYFEEAVKLAKNSEFEAIVTAPMSKTIMAKNNYKQIGHTEILQDAYKDRLILPFFWGQKFSVLLVTSHIPIEKVSGLLSFELVKSAILLAHSGRFMIAAKARNHPIGVLGLNPHSGESKLIGTEDADVIAKAVTLLSSTVAVEGPLVPDVAFQEKFWSKYSMYVSMYHDQGLIPFKMIHSTSLGIQLSLGLPFVRTSVDHGTAKEIFGKGIADYRSMKLAIEKAFEFCRLKERS